MAEAMGRIMLMYARQWPLNAWLYPGARGELFSSSNPVINTNYCIAISLNLPDMFPLQGSQEEHWQGKISWKCHFPAKADSILIEKCSRGFTKAPRQVIEEAPASLGAEYR